MKNTYPGFFVIIEGIDGSGKSTLANNLYLALKKQGKDCLLTFEPTKGQWGAILRQSFFSEQRLAPEQELNLFMKDREEHIEKVIVPALKQGRIVICDRYFYSTAAYQGARGLDPIRIIETCKEASIEPDLCIFLEIEPQEAVKRIRHGRKEDVNNFEELDYLTKVAHIYDQIKDECVVLDAQNSIEDLIQQAISILLERLKEKVRSSSS